MTSPEELSNHIGGLIKILDPLIKTKPHTTKLIEPHSFPSDQIALLLEIIHSRPSKYELYQNHIRPIGQTRIVKLLLNGTLYSVCIFLPRIQLL